MYEVLSLPHAPQTWCMQESNQIQHSVDSEHLIQVSGWPLREKQVRCTKIALQRVKIKWTLEPQSTESEQGQVVCS